MPHIPTSIRAALGLAATAVAEARKLPETLPQLPVTALSTAMQASLRVQQQIATYAARGDEVINLLRGTSAEPPSWATFDDAPNGSGPTSTGPAAGFGTGRPTAAFDRVATEAANLEDTGLDDGPEFDGLPGYAESAPAKKAPAKKAAAKRAVPVKRAAPPQQAAQSEPLEEAAKKADPSGPPTPSTMAAEILHAHEAENHGAETHEAENHEADAHGAETHGAENQADQDPGDPDRGAQDTEAHERQGDAEPPADR